MNKNSKTVIRLKVFANKKKFHKEQAKLLYVEKIRILFELQAIAYCVNEIKKNKKEG